MSKHSYIGKSVPRVDAKTKVTGEAIFTSDFKLPGMLWGKIKRSPYPFARLLSIDISQALKLPGVREIITARDIIQFPYGSVYGGDELPLVDEYVRYVGDEIAAVAAIDSETAEEALERIEIEYEELEPVLDVEKAMEPDAPSVHPEISEVKQNIAHHIEFVRGAGNAAFQEADLILERRFSTQAAHQCPLETRSCVAVWDNSSRLNIWASTQAPFKEREHWAKALCIPAHHIMTVALQLGGGFGFNTMRIFPINALLSKKAGKPVKIVLTREEEFLTTRPTHSEIIDLRMGFKQDGTMVAKESTITADSGAYAGNGPNVLAVSAVRPDCIYRLANIKFVGNLVYTNKIPRGSYRGFGNPQMAFAMESMIDMAADELGIDPLEIRLKNATQNGDITAHGWNIKSCGLTESLHKASEASGWKKKRANTDKKHGIGMACQVHVGGHRGINPLYDGSAAIVKMDQYGKAKVVSGEREIGQGSTTIFAQIAAEELGISLEDVEALPVDSNVSPYCHGTFGSRVTILGGNAVRMAAIDARAKLLEFAAEKLQVSTDSLTIKNGFIYAKDSPEKMGTVKEVAHHAVFMRAGTPIIGEGTYRVPDYVVVPDRKSLYGNYSLGYAFSTQVAEVLIDRETGKVDILNMWVGEDIGKAINPMMVEGQLEGGITQGMGLALNEDYSWNKGRILNPNFTDYKIPGSIDMTRIHSIFIETNNPGSPYGAKSVGEAATNPTAPAIANAIYNAVGIRITDLPITPEKILIALKRR